MRRALISGLTAFAALFYVNEVLTEASLTPAGRFLLLEEKFIRYDRAMFGSRPYYERILREYLNEIIYQEIETPSDFSITPSGAVHGRFIRSKLRHRSWLDIIGPVNTESLITALKDDQGRDRHRVSETMFSVRGKIKWARISRNPRGRSVELYVEEIFLGSSN